MSARPSPSAGSCWRAPSTCSRTTRPRPPRRSWPSECCGGLAPASGRRGARDLGGRRGRRRDAVPHAADGGRSRGRRVFGAVLVVVTATMLLGANRVRERLVEALREQATVDALTGLASRRAFDGALDAEPARPTRGGTALVPIDVDAFTTINDSHGHPVGDDVPVHLARVLRDNVRAEDAVLPRLGGDELAVLQAGRRLAAGRRPAGRRPRPAAGAGRRHPALAVDQRRRRPRRSARQQPASPLHHGRRRAVRGQARRSRAGGPAPA